MNIKRSDGLAWRTIDGETFVVDLRKKWMFGLNRQGSCVWQGIVDGETLNTIVSRVAMLNEMSQGPEIVHASVVAFIHTLNEVGLVCELPRAFTAPESEDPHFEGSPAITWSEELKAFAQSCTSDPIQCQAPLIPQA